MFDGGLLVWLGSGPGCVPTKAILRVLFPIPARRGLAKLGRGGDRAPFTHASGSPCPVAGRRLTLKAGGPVLRQPA